MQEHPFDHLYGLALNLVPDPDVAGDLFMDAHSEDDLRRRADRWRRQNGLPPAAPGMAPRPLGPAEREYAAHLARRRRMRQRTRVTLEWVGAVAVAAGAVLLALLRPGVGVDLVSTIRNEPAAATQTAGPILLTVDRAEATPGSVTVSWTLDGPEAASLAGKVRPELQLPTGDRVAPVASEVTPSGRTRLLGRATFRTTATDETARFILLGFGREGERSWQVGVSLVRTADPGAREIPVDQFVQTERNIAVHIKSVTVARDYTLVHYQPQGDTYNLVLAHNVVLQAGGSTLKREAVWVSDHRTEERTIVFPPLPEGVAAVTISFPDLVVPRIETVQYSLPGAPVVHTWQRQDEMLVGLLALDPGTMLRDVRVEVVDKGGLRHAVGAGLRPADAQNRLRIVLHAQSLPPEDQLADLVIEGLRTDGPAPALKVDL